MSWRTFVSAAAEYVLILADLALTAHEEFQR